MKGFLNLITVLNFILKQMGGGYMVVVGDLIAFAFSVLSLAGEWKRGRHAREKEKRKYSGTRERDKMDIFSK